MRHSLRCRPLCPQPLSRVRPATHPLCRRSRSVDPSLEHAENVHGWGSLGAVCPHIDSHSAEQLEGAFSLDWLAKQKFAAGEVCSRVKAAMFNYRCSSCYHAVVRAPTAPAASRALVAGAPTVLECFESVKRADNHLFLSIIDMSPRGDLFEPLVSTWKSVLDVFQKKKRKHQNINVSEKKQKQKV